MASYGEVKNGSLKCKFAEVPKEKFSPIRGRTIDTKFEEKIRAVKNENISRQPVSTQKTAKRRAPMPPPLKKSKPWPGRKTTTVDELVKHMSNVPSYLQRTDREENLQEKALNFGVLEWGLLEKWTSQQRNANHSSDAASTSSTRKSLSFSTLQSSAQSSASTNSNTCQRKQSPVVNGSANSSVSSEQKLLEKTSDKVICFSGSRHHLSSALSGCDNYVHLENHAGIDGLRLDHAALRSNSLPSTPQNGEASKLLVAKGDTTKQEEKVHHCSCSLYADGDKQEDSCFSLSQNNECICDQLQQSFHAMCINFDSFNAGVETERSANRFSDDFPEDIKPADHCPYVPHSSPLPTPVFTEESDTGVGLMRKGSAVYTKAKDEDVSRKQSVTAVFEKPAEDPIKFSDFDGKNLPNHFSSSGLKWTSHSSSFREAPVQQSESIPSVGQIRGDKAAANKKGRRSPLRRMLDPLLKPRNRTCSSGPAVSSSIQHSHESRSTEPPRTGEYKSRNVQRRSVDKIVGPNHEKKTNLDYAHCAHSSERCLHHEKNVSTRQALLQLAWKNGLPLFMLSSGDSDVLAATVRRKVISEKDDTESIYTLFTVQEPKRKSSAWIRTGMKSKKEQLVSNVVGEIRVLCPKSRCCSSQTFHIQRHFILLGVEPLPSLDSPIDSQVNRELAAIISKVPVQLAEGSDELSVPNSALKNSAPANGGSKKCFCNPPQHLQPDHNNGTLAVPSVIAILPSGFHGSSTSGEPSPLIERWKSGGACDCGGWDEGCMLTVLSDDPKECSSNGSQVCQTIDGSQRFELFAQGRCREDGHAFSMTCFKEGLYTVEFSGSITLLQAFVISIAMLHSRSSKKPQLGVLGSQERGVIADQGHKITAAKQGRAPTSYVPYHPPLSPVGRA